eukprot:TRINITY_DN907_c0_g1_i3.p1 TRINITY_DN907_c0_g1~~TRINITY_DN907_c0_g1_i3.p1  ORF type:complete len:152 (-),score=27.68 TRINITY_DN907_c0_g1_i3:341-796(-)
MKYVDGTVILLVSIISALVCEGISWLLIYRTPSYRNLRSSIDRTSRRVDAMKGKGGTAAALARGKRAKKIDRFESSLKDANKTLSMSKFQNMSHQGMTEPTAPWCSSTCSAPSVSAQICRNSWASLRPEQQAHNRTTYLVSQTLQSKNKLP